MPWVLQRLCQRWASAVFIEPGTGVGAGGLDGELFLEGITVSGFDECGCYAPVTDGTRNVSMDYVHDTASDYVCEISRMAVCLDLEAAKVFVVFHPCVHCITVFQKRNILLLSQGKISKEMPGLFSESF